MESGWWKKPLFLANLSSQSYIICVESGSYLVNPKISNVFGGDVSMNQG